MQSSAVLSLASKSFLGGGPCPRPDQRVSPLLPLRALPSSPSRGHSRGCVLAPFPKGRVAPGPSPPAFWAKKVAATIRSSPGILGVEGGGRSFFERQRKGGDTPPTQLLGLRGPPARQVLLVPGSPGPQSPAPLSRVRDNVFLHGSFCLLPPGLRSTSFLRSPSPSELVPEVPGDLCIFCALEHGRCPGRPLPLPHFQRLLCAQLYAGKPWAGFNLWGCCGCSTLSLAPSYDRKKKKNQARDFSLPAVLYPQECGMQGPSECSS